MEDEGAVDCLELTHVTHLLHTLTSGARQLLSVEEGRREGGDRKEEVEDRMEDGGQREREVEEKRGRGKEGKTREEGGREGVMKEVHGRFYESRGGQIR